MAAGRGRICARLRSRDEEERCRRQGALVGARTGHDRRGYGHSRRGRFRTRTARRTYSKQLVSYRHSCPPERGGKRALTDACGGRMPITSTRSHVTEVCRRLLAPVQRRQVKLISEQPIHFNGRDEKLLVYYNPAPLPNALPPRIDDPCIDVTRGRTTDSAYVSRRPYAERGGARSRHLHCRRRSGRHDAGAGPARVGPVGDPPRKRRVSPRSADTASVRRSHDRDRHVEPAIDARFVRSAGPPGTGRDGAGR